MPCGTTGRVRFRRAQNDGTATAVSNYHTHSIPLDMEDIERDWDRPIAQAGIAAKASVIVRVGMLDLGAGTGSFRVREMMHRVAYPLGVHVRADVNLTDIAATCTDGKNRITEVIDLPTTGVNTERIWLLEHFADWFNIHLGKGSVYHAQSVVSEELVEHLDRGPHLVDEGGGEGPGRAGDRAGGHRGDRRWRESSRHVGGGDSIGRRRRTGRRAGGEDGIGGGACAGCRRRLPLIR